MGSEYSPSSEDAPSSEAGQPEAPPYSTDHDILGVRVAAALVDLAVILAVAVGVGVAVDQAATDDLIALFRAAVLAVLVFVFVYYFLFEATVGGTVGKLVLGVRVVGRQGGRPSTAAAAIRTAVRVIDWLPFFYVVGLVTMLVTGERRQRLGDLAAGTRVERVAPIRRRGLVVAVLGSFVFLAIAGSVVAVLMMSGFLSGGTLRSSSCLGARCNVTVQGAQTLVLSDHVVAVDEIGAGQATFTADGESVALRAGETREVGGSLVHLVSVEGEVAEFSVDFSGLFVDRADLQNGARDEVATYRSYSQVADDSGSITIEVPIEWTDVDGAETQFGPSIHAAPDLQQFLDTWDVPGVIVEASAQHASETIDTLMKQLGPSGQCSSEGREAFENEPYSGSIERWSRCGDTDARAVTAVLATPDDRSVVSVFGQAVNGRDLEAIQRVLSTVEIGTLPLLSDEEWLAEVDRVREEIDRDFWGFGSELTAPVMREMAKVLRTGGSELASIGPPSERLERSHTLVKRARRQYDKGAKCLMTAARIGVPFEGSSDDRRQSKAIDCGFDGTNRGSSLLFEAKADAEGTQIQEPG
jgi:uncharacterized RDD family membrane protein YckC